MIYIVILILTFSDGSVVQKSDVTAPSFTECVNKIIAWKDEMRTKYKTQTNPAPSTFITGCSKKD